MYRTLCVLAVLTLQAGLAHNFSWDIFTGAGNHLDFYNEEKFTYSVTFLNVQIHWITYDPLHNRVLLMNSSKSLLSFDIATEKIQTLIDLKLGPLEYDVAYDPATSLLFLTPQSSNKMYSYLVKPESNHEVDANFVIDLGGSHRGLAVDSCGGYIYWIFRGGADKIERARLSGSKREEVIESSPFTWRYALTIDPQTQNMYWTEYEFEHSQYSIHSADLNGKHMKTLTQEPGGVPISVTVSKDFIYWTYEYEKIFGKFPKNPLGTFKKPKQIGFKGNQKSDRYIAANYVIEEQLQGTPLCKALKRLLPNYSATNDSDSLNVSTGGSLLPVNETTVSGESRVTGDVSVCHNYCLQGNCSVSAEGQPGCRCNAGYSGVRCEVHECHTYCLNDGVCTLSEQNNPVCQCAGGYQGERCDVPDFLIKCSQAVSLLKDILNADLPSVTEGKGVKSTTCASTVV